MMCCARTRCKEQSYIGDVHPSSVKRLFRSVCAGRHGKAPAGNEQLYSTHVDALESAASLLMNLWALTLMFRTRKREPAFHRKGNSVVPKNRQKVMHR